MFADDVVQLDADCAVLCLRPRCESARMLPQKWQAPLHDAHDGAPQRESEGLHVGSGEMSKLPNRFLRGSSPDLQA